MGFLNKIRVGRKRQPLTMLFYGVHGVGKTDFALNSDNPIFIGNEDNGEVDGHVAPIPANFSELYEQIQELIDHEHSYKTCVVDSLDMLEQLAETEILKEQPNKTMATAFGGYGKAYEKMSNMFLKLRNLLIELREKRGMNIILISHAEKSKEQDPETLVENIFYKPNLHKKVAPIFEDWVGAVIFATQYRVVSETDDGKKYNEGDGTRVIMTEARPSHVAKNRYNFPYKMKFEKGKMWNVLKKYVDQFYAESKGPLDPEKIAHAKELAKKAPEDLQAKILEAIEKAADNTAMDKIILRLEELKK